MGAQILARAKVFEHSMLAEGSLLIARKGVSERRILEKTFRGDDTKNTSDPAKLQGEKQTNYPEKG